VPMMVGMPQQQQQFVQPHARHQMMHVHPPPPAPPPRPPMPPQELERACATAVASLVGAGNFASYQAVAARVCTAYGVATLQQLGVLDPLGQAPVLAKIWRIQQLVEAHVGAFVGMRGVACLADLEVELVAMLRSFQFRPVLRRELDAAAAAAVAKNNSINVNPEEIALHSDDDDYDNDATGAADAPPVVLKNETTETFADFGLGPLAAVPSVQHHFQPPPELGYQHTAAALTSADAARQLATFLEVEERGGGHNRNGAAVGVVLGVDFARFLCESYGVATTSALGVRVDPGPLGVERQVARHVAAAANREAERAAAANRVAVATAEAAEAAAKLAELPPPPPRLRPPRGAGARDFLERCGKALATPWRPSHGGGGCTAVESTRPIA
jgi:hypothetical protein